MAGGDNSIGYLRQINEKMDRLLAIAERYVGGPVDAAAAEVPAAAAAFPPKFAAPKVSLLRSTAQGAARIIRRMLEKGVADMVAKAKLENDLRELQPKINAEIAAGIPLESEFQGQYDGILQFLQKDLKPESRARAERVRNELKAKLNAEQAALAGSKGGYKKRKATRRRKTRNRRN